MVRNSASAKHKFIQERCKTWLEDHQHTSWRMGEVRFEWDSEGFRADVLVEYYNAYKHVRHYMHVEIQNDLKEPSFLEKHKLLVKTDKIKPTFSYVVIPEACISDNYLDAYEEVGNYLMNGLPW